MKKKGISNLLIFLAIIAIVLLILSLSSVLALDSIRENRLAFGHVLYINDVVVEPSKIPSGNPGTVKFTLQNTATDFLRDVRIELSLPPEIAPYNDITKKKIAELQSGESATVSFSIVPLPTTVDGVYKVSVMTTYLNYIGDERQENDTVSIIVGSTPKLLAEFKSSDIYRGKQFGTVKINVINNNIGNVKFLTADLKESADYNIMGSNSNYIGDLNSDDFSEANFKLELLGEKTRIELPLVLNYKDALNKDYSQEVKVYFEVPTANQAGIQKSNTPLFIVLAIIAVVGFLVYRRYNKNILKMKKAALSSLKIDTKF